MKPLRLSGFGFHLVILTSIAMAASGQVTIRPISHFISTQGTFCVPDGNGGCELFVPPVANFPGAQRGASVDYAGLAEAYVRQASGGAISLGTSFSGRVIERRLHDGRAQVLLFTKNALAWVAEVADRFPAEFISLHVIGN